jgi:hypothetical protein
MTRSNRLALLLLPLLAGPLLAGCATGDPAMVYLGGAGDPIRGAALNAPFQFGDLSASRGQPARTALSLAQMEFLADRIPQDGYWTAQIPPTTIMQLQAARAEARRAVGIAPAAPPDRVIAALRQVAGSQQGLNPAGAQEALSGPEFPLGGTETMRRLTELGDLRQADIAAGAINNDIMSMSNKSGR